MPSYFVNNGIKQEMNDELFDLMSSMLKQSTCSSNTSSTTSSDEESADNIKYKKGEWRRQENGYYNKAPNDINYYKKYYQEKVKQPCSCDICGKT